VRCAAHLVSGSPQNNARFAGLHTGLQRPATEADADACNRLCRQVHGHDRNGELIDAIRLRTASVVVRGDRITGYTSTIAFFGHAVAETNADLMAMIAAAPEFGGPGFLVPTRNYELLSWCLGNRLRLVYQMTLMTIGIYSESAGVWLPSETYLPKERHQASPLPALSGHFRRGPECPLLALSRHSPVCCTCPLSGVKRTSR
jgi:hypothetical protein